MLRIDLSDLRHATRSLARVKGVTLVTLLIMALGVGATTAVFSVIESVLLRPLPYPESDRLVVPRTRDAGANLTYNTTYPEFLLWQDEGVFESAAAGLRARPRPGWRVAVGSELEMMNADDGNVPRVADCLCGL